MRNQKRSVAVAILGPLLCAVLTLTLFGCASLTGPAFGPPDATPVPPAVWVPEWIAVTEAADRLDQRTPAYPPLGVYYVPPATDEPFAGFECGHRYLCWGLYIGGRVYVVTGLGTYEGNVLQHEMLHHIIGGNADPDHCSYLWPMLNLSNGTTCGSVSRGDHDTEEV